MSYYVCKSGEVLAQAKRHRANYIRMKKALFEFAAGYGAENIKADTDMMLLHGIEIPGQLPAGWIRPAWLHGFSRPAQSKVNTDVLKWFTPPGGYIIERHLVLQEFYDWLAFPREYDYIGRIGCVCSASIPSSMGGPELHWVDERSPILLYLPSLPGIKALLKAQGYTPTDNALDWKLPEGLQGISDYERDYIVAKYKFMEFKKRGNV